MLLDVFVCPLNGLLCCTEINVVGGGMVRLERLRSKDDADAMRRRAEREQVEGGREEGNSLRQVQARPIVSPVCSAWLHSHSRSPTNNGHRLNDSGVSDGG